jgi:vesicle-associated membrane protein 4
MADREQPYDPYIPAGGAGAQHAGQPGAHRTAAIQSVCSPTFSRISHTTSAFRDVAAQCESLYTDPDLGN